MLQLPSVYLMKLFMGYGATATRLALLRKQPNLRESKQTEAFRLVTELQRSECVCVVA